MGHPLRELVLQLVQKTKEAIRCALLYRPPKQKNPEYSLYKGFYVAGTGLEPVTFGL